MQDQTKPHFVERALFQASEIRLIEQQSAKASGYALYHLMESAGMAAWNFLNKHWTDAQNITIICGKGNNAGDGFVLARLAASKGKTVQVLTVTENPEYQGDAQVAFKAMEEQGISTSLFKTSLLSDQQLIVDAILGTGLKGPLRKNFQQLIEQVNDWVKDSAVPVFAIDIPSGLGSDTGVADPVAIVASRTLSFIALKSGMVTGQARACCGQIEVDALGIEPKFQDGYAPVAWIDDADRLIGSLPKRSNTAHKGDNGHLLLVGGDYGFGGAILMSAMAAGRCGVGMMTILTRDAHVAPILTQCPEAMIRSISDASDPALQKILGNVDGVVIGPGLGQEDWAVGLLNAICATELPLLIDADALNLLAGKELGKAHWVLTPHPGEAGRLLGVSTADIESNRYQAVTSLQQKYSAVAVLKGAGTLIKQQNQLPTV
ncbi:MAG: bifunctional ADP-dependent NAD(P)H-hydrate dehydratase/NAD(P)H-hydrate epimerase, partial [Gammaproteobacteria bacterium]